jgi:diguanylate cyclase (GGDEF)-like protein
MAMEEHAFETAEIPPWEEERLDELYNLRLLDTASETRFDNYTHLVADIFDFPIVLVSLVDRDRQWFKSSQGWSVKECSRDTSFCSHTILKPGVTVIPDALLDKRFASNPLVSGPPHIRFYAGAKVHGPQGRPIGTLCVIDHVPRDFNEVEQRRLQQFAALIENEIRHSADLEATRTSVEFTAYYDALTHLPNRRLFTDRLTKLLEWCEWDQRELAVVLFNVEELRLINQGFGTEMGDQLLKSLGDRLEGYCPSGGSLARLQADEFIMAVPVYERAKLDTLVDNLHQALCKPLLIGAAEYYLNVQIGGAVYPEHGTTTAALIEGACAAIRFPGTGDAPGIRFFSRSASTSVAERLKIESRLRCALETRAFELVYQPIIAVATGRLAKVEALMRWRDEQLGDVSPAQFIPIVEQSGMAQALGSFLHQRVCAQLAEWGRDNAWDIPVAINVAASELVVPSFSESLLACLAEAHLPPASIEVEITEYSLVNDSHIVEDNLANLGRAGVRVSIDDFGTGYSSLSYLRRLPINTLKIDRSFVCGLPQNQHQSALSQTILSMAKSLKLQTVAEGVETAEQYSFFADAGCSFIQGFLISPPVTAAEIPAMRGNRLWPVEL